MFKLARILAIASIPIVALSGTTAKAFATVGIPCGDRAKLVSALKNKYSEVPVALGVSQKNTEAFEVFASESGTWSLVMTTSTGKTCIMAVGHSWTELEKVSTDPET